MREDDPFLGPSLKLGRARRHIADYRLAFKAVAESNIVRVTPQVGPDGDWCKVELTEPMPADLRLTAADALYNSDPLWIKQYAAQLLLRVVTRSRRISRTGKTRRASMCHC